MKKIKSIKEIIRKEFKDKYSTLDKQKQSELFDLVKELGENEEELRSILVRLGFATVKIDIDLFLYEVKL